MKPSRRNFLFQVGSAAGGGYLATQLPPVRKLIDLMLKDVFRKAQANVESLPTIYLQIALIGAPARWCFDQFLKTRSDQSNARPPIMASTIFTGAGSATGAAYQLVPYGNLLVPPLWNTMVAGRSGQRPLNDLLDSMLVFRGYGTGIDGHASNASKQSNPVPAIGSVGGHIADHSPTLLKAIQFPVQFGTSGYSSIRGTGLTGLYFGGSSANYVLQLLQPFAGRADSVIAQDLRGKYKSEIAAVQSLLMSQMSNDRVDFGTLRTDYEQALTKMEQGIGQLQDQWDPLFHKYFAIANSTFKDKTVQGFTDKPIVTDADDGKSSESVWSLRVNGAGHFPSPGQDIRNWINGCDLAQLASTFALAEFAILNGLTSAYDMSFEDIQGMTGEFVRSETGPLSTPTTKTFRLEPDMHQTGIMPTLFLSACLFRTVGACMLELIDQLKANNLYSLTAIHLSQEFGRLPRNSGGGSDHGFDAMISSVWTGLRSGGPKVMGNIRADGTLGQAPASIVSGTFGFKAPTQISGIPTLLTPAHVASSLAQILQIPDNPWGNVATPLVIRSGSQLQFNVGDGEVVES